MHISGFYKFLLPALAILLLTPDHASANKNDEKKAAKQFCNHPRSLVKKISKCTKGTEFLQKIQILSDKSMKAYKTVPQKIGQKFKATKCKKVKNGRGKCSADKTQFYINAKLTCNSILGEIRSLYKSHYERERVNGKSYIAQHPEACSPKRILKR